MKQIIAANGATMAILGKEKLAASDYRLMNCCVATKVEEGVLLFNLLTRELILLTPEEYHNVLELPYLRRQWFVVPEETDERKLVEKVRWVHSSMSPKSKQITRYTIFTTTDCNARCFYCFEKGRLRISMNEETAVKTADFIKNNCDGKKVSLSWFGGEPLYNASAISWICEELEKNDVPFQSSMISNGYLFDDEMVEKAKNKWHLNWVQITLDGTEDVYNRYKAFIYENGSAYQVVMGNIERLLKKGIRVAVRLNIDFHNADNLMELASALAECFGGQKGFVVYTHLIFDDKIPWDKRYTMEQWEELYSSQRRLEERLEELGIGQGCRIRLKRKIPQNFCMADDDDAIVIMPDGSLGVCEHFSDSEQIGNISSTKRDEVVIAKFRKKSDEIPECAGCFYYPECIRLQNCPDSVPCTPMERFAILRRTQRGAVNEFRRWKEKLYDVEEEFAGLC